LVVDDNVINREILSTMLERANERVTQAVNGQEAVESVVSRASGCGFDAILVDLRLPVMDGVEAI
jgi:CheY-like chemotaxis protein